MNGGTENQGSDIIQYCPFIVFLCIERIFLHQCFQHTLQKLPPLLPPHHKPESKQIRLRVDPPFPIIIQRHVNLLPVSIDLLAGVARPRDSRDGDVEGSLRDAEAGTDASTEAELGEALHFGEF